MNRHIHIWLVLLITLNSCSFGLGVPPYQKDKVSVLPISSNRIGSLQLFEDCVIIHKFYNDDIEVTPASQIRSEDLQDLVSLQKDSDEFSPSSTVEHLNKFLSCLTEDDKTKQKCLLNLYETFLLENTGEKASVEGDQSIVTKINKCLVERNPVLNLESEIRNTKSRSLTSIVVANDYPELKGLSIAIISLTAFIGVVYYLQYLWKGMDASPFWILLHFIQIVYLMIILEVNQPANLVYFLDRLKHIKLDLSAIDEFTTIRDEVIDEVNFRPDRTSFTKLDWAYGSVLVNLAFYARIVCTVIIVHLILKVILSFKKEGNKNPVFEFLSNLRKHISNVFYIRYCLEISLFLWTAIFVEFVSTNRDSSLEKLSLMVAINILCFLLYFTFSFCFAFYANNTKETYRGYYYTYFLMKRAILPICLISFAYTSMEAQLAVLMGVQLTFIVVEVILGILDKDDHSKVLYMGQSIINRLLSIGCNGVLFLYLALMFMFLDENPSANDSNGETLAYCTAAFILLLGLLILGIAVLRMFCNKQEANEESSGSVNDQIEEQVEMENQNPHQKAKDQENHPELRSSEVNQPSMEKSSKFREGTSPQSSEEPSKNISEES